MRQDPATVLLHALDDHAPGEPAGSAVTFATYRISAGEADPGDYLRADQPNWRTVERAVGALEEGHAVLFPSGQAASHAVLADLARTHRRIVLPDDGYYNTRALAAVAAAGTEVRTVDLLDTAAVGDALAPAGAVLWAEAPTNPLLRVADLAALAAVAAGHGAPMVADNTIATAVLQRPLDLGAWATVTSLTKAAAGHSDLLLGAVVTRDAALADRLRDWRTVTGAVPGAFAAWLAARSLRTLPLRLARQCATALAIATHLHGHGRVTRVHYPGLVPQRAVADRQMTGGYGPLLSFEVDGPAAAADAVVDASRLIRAGTSFGGVASSWERRARWAAETAPPTLIRLAVGVEGPDDLIGDVDHALATGLT